VAHSRGHRFPRTSNRRQTSWEIGPEEVNGSTSSSAAKLWSGAVTPVTDGLTVIRIRGYVRVILSAASAAGSGYFGAMGIGIAEDAAIAIGVTAVPTPLTEEASENWLWFQYFDIRSVTATIADGSNAFGVTAAFDIDSKAMRKLPFGKTLYGASEFVESDTSVIETQASSRVLVKLP